MPVKALDYEAQSQQSVTVKAKDALGRRNSYFHHRNRQCGRTNPLFKTGTSGSGTALTGEAGNDVLRGLGGNETLRGQAGNEMTSGSSGRKPSCRDLSKTSSVFDTKPSKTTTFDRIVYFFGCGRTPSSCEVGIHEDDQEKAFSSPLLRLLGRRQGA